MNVRPLTTPTDDEIAQLAAIFDRYRAHYGETGDAATTRSWLRGHIDAGRLGAFVRTVRTGSRGSPSP